MDKYTITCPKCLRVIGRRLIIDGKPFLELDCGLVVRSLHGVCTCGEDFHYTVSDVLLKQLIENVKKAQLF